MSFHSERVAYGGPNVSSEGAMGDGGKCAGGGQLKRFALVDRATLQRRGAYRGLGPASTSCFHL